MNPLDKETGRPRLPGLIAVCGKGRIAANALLYIKDYLRAEGHSIPIRACPCRGDPGYDTWYPSLLRAAAETGAEVVALATLESIPDVLLVSLEFDAIIKVDRFVSKRLFNIHFSKLPRYRGVFTSIWPLLNGERESGVTLHVLEAGIDSGAIIAQRVFPLFAHTTARTLYDQYMNEGFELLKQSLPLLLSDVYPSQPQDEGLATYYSRSSLKLDHDVLIDLHSPAEAIERQVRAFYFPEYQMSRLAERRVRACHSIVAPPAPERAGSVLHADAQSAVCVAGDGRLLELVWA